MRSEPPSLFVHRESAGAAVGPQPRQAAQQCDPRFFPDPEVFVPTRWAAPPEAGPARYAYLPFGRGPRQCLGEGFAWLEGLLVLTTLAQTWRLLLIPGPPVEPWGLVTLRPKAGIPVRLARR